MNQSTLNQYFSTVWTSNLKSYRYSGWELLKHIHTSDTVLDVGCGFNEFKNYLPNLIGIDPANRAADIITTIEDYSNPEYFDVALCLGSINFGNEDVILKQVQHVIDCLKPSAKIYWRCNPGIADHGNSMCQDIEFFPWSEEKHAVYCKLFNFELLTCKWDNNNRLYAEWGR